MKVTPPIAQGEKLKPRPNTFFSKQPIEDKEGRDRYAGLVDLSKSPEQVIKEILQESEEEVKRILEALRNTLKNYFKGAGIFVSDYTNYLRAQSYSSATLWVEKPPLESVSKHIKQQNALKAAIYRNNLAIILNHARNILDIKYGAKDEEFIFRLSRIHRIIEEVCVKYGWDPYPDITIQKVPNDRQKWAASTVESYAPKLVRTRSKNAR